MARWKEDAFSEELDAKASAFDGDGVAASCGELLDHLRSRKDVYPEPAAKKVLAALRRKRYFDWMARVADAFLRAGQESPQIRRQYAQALLDLGNVSGALSVLRGIQAQENVPAKEYAEAGGLIGRAHKQIYVDAADATVPHYRKHLLRAIDAYHAVYESDPSTYLGQGVNAASLLWRAKKDGVDVGDRPVAGDIAKRVRDEVEDKRNEGTATMWDLASAAEASIVLGNFPEAGRYLYDYVDSEYADAFEIASTLRQFEEVLRLDREEVEDAVCLDLLREKLLQRGGGSLQADAATVRRWSEGANRRADGLEALLGPDRPVTHRWVLKGLKRAAGVARIWRGTEGAGTGFLVPGALLSSKWKDHQVLCTNNHVISKSPTLAMTLLPEEASVTFDALHENDVNQPSFEVKEVLYESALRDLDVTFCRLRETVAGVEPFDVAKAMPLKVRDERIYVIGHPQGQELSYSFHDNKLIDIDERRLQYRSPTEPGSSGSPLFNDRWELIGIHHAGSKAMRRLDDPDRVHEANEGIPLPSIRAAIAAKLGG